MIRIQLAPGQQVFDFDILRTEMATDHIYLDLIRYNGVLYTFVMEKIEDPNIYGIKEQIDGEDRFDELLEKYALA